MLDAYAERRKRELYELGSVQASAAHDPKALRALEPESNAGVSAPVRDWFDAYERRN